MPGSSFGRSRHVWRSAATPIVVAWVIICAAVPNAVAKSGSNTRYHIAPQALASAIQQLGLQGRRQIIFSPTIASGLLKRSLSGRMSFDRALGRLLDGTGLVFSQTESGVIVIGRGQERGGMVPITAADRPIATLPGLTVTAYRRNDPAAFLSDIRVRPQEPTMAVLLNNGLGISSEPAGSGQQALIVRGVGMAGEATTMVYFAGVPISGPSGTGSDSARSTSDLALVDIGRIIISRTARSSEHGTGSLAGEIEIEPENAHLGEWQAISTARVGVKKGGDPDAFAVATLNAPIGANAAVRATGYVQRDGGYIDNVRTGMLNVNDDDIAGFRLVTRVAPTPDLDISAILAWQHRRVGDTSSWFRALGAYRMDRYFSAPTTHDFLLARLGLRHDLGDIELTALSAAYRWKLDRRYDRSNVTLLQGSDPDGCRRYFDLTVSSCDPAQDQQYSDYVSSLAPSLLHIPIRSTRVLQEVRLGSRASTGLRWGIGLLVDDRTEKLRSELSSVPPEQGGQPVMFGARRLGIHRRQTALFGNLAYRDADGLLAAVGLRFDDYRVSSRNDVVVPNLLSGSVVSWPLTTEKSRGVSGNVHVDVPIMPGATWHTQLARSIRSGGVNTASVLLPDRLTFAGDSLWGVEMGFKLRLGQRADMILMTYINNWRDMQYRALSENRSHAYLVNLGNATIRGAELEFVLRPGQGIIAKTQASLIRAEMGRVTGDASLVGGANAGDSIPFVPARRMQASIERSWTVGQGDQITVEGDWQYQSGFSSTFNADDPDYVATSAFTLFGARLSYRRSTSDIAVQVRNLFDRIANVRTVTNGYGVGQSFSYGPRSILFSWNRRW